MFEPSKPFYMTRRVAEELNNEHQQLIFQYMLNHYKELTDYLQIFEFCIENNQQILVQRQEEPNKETKYAIELKSAKPIERKVWVMDQADYVMLLFPEDY